MRRCLKHVVILQTRKKYVGYQHMGQKTGQQKSLVLVSQPLQDGCMPHYHAQHMLMRRLYLQDHHGGVAPVCRIMLLAPAHEGRRTTQQHLHAQGQQNWRSQFTIPAVTLFEVTSFTASTDKGCMQALLVQTSLQCLCSVRT